jgi:plasmid stability protein
MAQILVRQIEDDVLERLRERARANERSTEAEIRKILADAVRLPGENYPSLTSLIGAAPSARTQDEIVDYVRSLREEWDRER